MFDICIYLFRDDSLSEVGGSIPGLGNLYSLRVNYVRVGLDFSIRFQSWYKFN